MFNRKFLNTLMNIFMIFSLLFGGVAPVHANTQDTQTLPAQQAAPGSPTDQTKVPHYYGPYSNWANSPQVLANAIVTISPVAPIPGSIGNSVTADRANATDTTANVFVVNTNTPLVAGSLTAFQTWAQTGSGTNTFNAYVLRPTGTPNQYTVVFDSGPLTVLNTVVGLQTFTLSTAFTVQAGDLIAHYGQGIPFDSTGGSDTTMSPVSVAPALSSVFTVNDANYPLIDTVHTYSIAATILPVVPGAGAEATATVDPKTGGISAITVIVPGSGYTSAPNVAISAPGLTITDPATATAVISTGSISSITVDLPGFGFTTPVVNLTGGSPTTPAAAVASGGVDTVVVSDGGLGYDQNAFPVFTAPNLPSGVQATGTLVLDANGTITGITVTNPGSGYTVAPTVTAITEPTTSLPTTAVITMPTATIGIGKVDVTAGGAGYQSMPAVTITDGVGGPDLGASAAAIGAVFGAVTTINVTHAGAGYLTPGIRKFVDDLPGLGPSGVNNLGQYIPVAVPDTTTYPGTDYYEIAVVQYRMKFHTDLPPTLLRGYVQLSTSVVPGLQVDLYNAKLSGGRADGKDDLIVGFKGVDNPHYLGPTIVATKNRPVRILFRNLLPTGSGGDLFLPVDTSLMGSGPGPNAMTLDGNKVPIDMAMDEGTVIDAVRNPACAGVPDLDPLKNYLKPTNCFSDNRATLHLHGGITPWISDGTPHQWTTPAGEGTDYPKGVSVSNVPDMPDPGPGAETFFYTNQQSARLMFYHDHAWGITRLNVYAGEAAPYLITDQTEQNLFGAGKPFADLGTGTPLVIQDKTFVSDNIASTDPTWDASRWGGTGSLWQPHVYMPAENPADPSGMSPFGRWFYGPYFWPPATSKYMPIDNPYFDPNCNLDVPATWQYKTYPFCEPATIPGTPNISVGMEAFMDTPIVNGTAYPKTTVDPKAYRFRILNAANDRFWNLSWYVADPTTGTLSEVALNPAELAAAQTDPNVFPTPDTTKSPAGPNWIQIGTEGGFLPAPTIIPAQPMTWITDPTRFDWGNGDKHSLLVAPAERADVIVDFSAYRGKTLILYNDAAAAFPARISNYDYYTGAPNLTGTGGAPSTLPGYGPNTRTIMKVTVSNAAPATAFDRPNTSNDRLGTLMTAFAHHADGSGVFESGSDPIIVGQAAYNGAYGTNFTGAGWCSNPTNPTARCDGMARINEGSQPTDLFKFDTLGPQKNGLGPQLQIPFQPKALHDEMNSANFDEFGRMTANLGLEAPGATPLNQNIILYPYVNPATEILDGTGLPSSLNVTPIASAADGTQIWKITHNGVDTHPIHFHLFNVQLLNRVTWDNIIIPPDANELGWKETIRTSPLEDTIVAVRPIVPTLPFGVPDSIRVLNPMMPLHAQGDPNTPLGQEAGFSNIDTTGNAITPPIPNEMTDFGWEYVWHCHILSHEEMDMMRPMTLHVARALADAPVLSAIGTSGSPVNLTWTDGTPVNYLDPATWGSPKAEIGYRIERAPHGGAFASLATALANVTGFTDNTTVPGTIFDYRVVVFNAAGETISNIASSTITPTYTVSGTVGALGAGATITYTGGTTTAAVGTGNYSFVVNTGWVGTITPSLTGYNFTPTFIDVTIPVTADLPNQNFVTAINTYTLTYTADPNGTISGTTPQTVNYGAGGTAVTAVPNLGYHFVNWSDLSTANPRTDINVTANVSVMANFAINTYTLTYTAGAGGTISGSSPQTVNYGASGTAVTAVPNLGYHFVNWSDLSTANPRTDTNVTANISVTANFAIDTFTLTYAADPNGSITGTTPQTVNYGASGTAVTAVPAANYHFVNWSDLSTANPRTDTNVTANISITANFAINTFDLTYTASPNGTISGTTPQTVSYGGSGSAVTAIPATGYHFVNWSDLSTANPRTDSNVTANISVTASFAIDTFTLTYTAGPNGTISGTSPQTVNYGGSGSAVTAQPATGYHFVGWSDGILTASRTDTNVTANISVTANFAIDTFTVSGASGSTGVMVVFSGTNGNPSGFATIVNASYSFTVPYGWTGTITPFKTGYTFSPASITISAPGVTANLPYQDFSATLNMYAISGSLGTTGATVAYSGTTSGSAIIIGSSYFLMVPYGWTGTITPSLTGYTFSPVSISVTTPVTAALTGQNFIATVDTFTVSGTLGTTGATVAYSGTTSGSATIVGSSYSFTAPYGWTGIITPSKMGYTFTPASITVTTPVTAALPNQNFTASLNTFTVSGALGTTGATLAFSGTTSGSATVVGSSYSFTAPYGWTGTITPSKVGYTFTPASITVTTPVTAALPNQNFSAAISTYTVSGTLGTTGATVAFSGTNGSASGYATITGSSYSFTALYGWTGVITPLRTGHTFSPTSITISTGLTANLPNQNFTTKRSAIADFNGDGKTDISIYRPGNAAWYINGVGTTYWGGVPGDIPVPADYNGDGKTEIAIYRPANGGWHIRTVGTTYWGGAAGDVPVPADYNGDGLTETAYYQPSNGAWYIKGASTTYWGGVPGDIPVPADYNGDGMAEIAIYRPSNGAWYINRVGTTYWGGVNGDIPVPADYNGDGLTEIAIYRPSNAAWYINGVGTSYWGGVAGDIPVPADYNGDGLTEIAIYRPSNAAWYVTGGGTTYWGGVAGDFPLPARDTNGNGTPYQ